MNTGYQKKQAKFLFWIISLFMLLSLFAGMDLTVKAAVNDDTTVLAFTSDVHNKSDNTSRNRLGTWIDKQIEAYGRIDYMGFCGDMGDASNSNVTENQFWTYSEAAISMVRDTKGIDSCFTTGNHEYTPGNFDTTANTTKYYYTVDSEAKNGSNYHIYCLGCAGSAQKYTDDQVTKLSNYFNNLTDYDPVIVLTHFPLHLYTGYWNNTRSTENAGSVIEALNNGVVNGRKVVLLWGHNHSQNPKDSHYDHIYKPEDSLDYASGKNKTIKFYYAAAGCMSDSEYVGSNNVQGKGLIIMIDAAKRLSFTYYNANRVRTEGYTENGFAGEVDVAVGLNTTSLPLEIGDVSQLTATVTPSSAAAKGVIWESDNSNVVTVDSNGYVTAKSVGTAHITATTNLEGKTARCTINVSAKPGAKYTVIWKNDNGTILQTDELEYGKTPSYIGPTPTKAATAQYTYSFKGWTPSVTTVTGPVEYTATYNSSIRYYTITWKDEDGNTLRTDSLAYGATPFYRGNTPSKASTDQYTYSFSGWSPGITTVTKDAEYTATFSRTTRMYNITWKNEDGNILKTEQVAYGTTPSYSGTPTKPSTNQYTYSFKGWSPSVSSVTKDAVYIATYTETIRKYSITWKNDDGTILKTDSLTYGETPSYNDANPTKTSTAQYTYSFKSWSPSIASVTADAVYTATYTPIIRKYTITWKNEDGTILRTEELAYGTTPNYTGSTPEKEATAQYTYSFSGWSPKVAAVTQAAVYTANYSQTTRKYDITWKNDDGTTLKTEQVAYGTTPSYNGTPTKASTDQYTYSFKSWSPSVTSVTKDAVYMATYTQTTRKYTITWKNDDGTVLKTDSLAYGATPTYTGAAPTKASTAQYTFNFKGWSPNVASVAKDAVYTATYTETVNKYSVTWKNDDGTILKEEELPYGTIPAYTGETPAKGSTDQYIYSFKGWSPNTAAVTRDVVYTATFTQTTRKYTITWKNEDGTTLKTDSVPYGQTPSYTGTAPTKEPTIEHSYHFKGWSPNIVPVTTDAVYTAAYTEGIREYTITWKNEDGTTLRTDSAAYKTTPSYSGETPKKEPTAQYTYSFKGWSPNITTVTKDAVYTATYTEAIRKYTITWENDDGTILQTNELAFGETPSYNGAEPTKESTAQYTYSFKGWSSEVTTVKSDFVYTAVYTATINKYKVSFVDEYGIVLKPEAEYEYGTKPSEIEKPVVSDKTGVDGKTWYFAGWTPEVTDVKEDVVYKAKYSLERQRFTIVFVDDDGSVLKAAAEYPYGTKAADILKPADPVKGNTAQYNYTFAGWDPKLADVTEDAVYKAVYTEQVNKYTITWKNDDGSILETDKDVPYGGKISYEGKTPEKKSDQNYTYTFTGWTPAVTDKTTVTGNASYVAQYKAIPLPASEKVLTVEEAKKAPADNSLPVINSENVTTTASIDNSALKINLGTTNADSYLIEYREKGTGTWKAVCYKAGTSITLNNVKVNGCYQLRYTAVKLVNGKWKKSKASKTSYLWMTKIKIKKIKATKKGMTLIWNKIKKTAGYEIRYSTDKAFRKKVKKVTVKGTNKLTKTISGLKKGKTYYVRISPYKKIGGKKYTGIASTTKKVKIK